MSKSLSGLDILILLELQQETYDVCPNLKKYLRYALLTKMIVAYARCLNKLRFLY